MAQQEMRGAALGDYLLMLWERRWIVIAAVVAATAFAVATSPPAPAPLYQAVVNLRVQTITFSVDPTNPVVLNSEVPAAEVQAVRAVEVAQQTARDLGLGSGQVILAGLSASTQENSDLIELRYINRGRDTELELLTYARNYVDFRNQQAEEQLQERLDALENLAQGLSPRLESLAAQFDRENASGDVSAKTQVDFETASASYTSILRLRFLTETAARQAGDKVELVGSPISQRLGSIPTGTLRVLTGTLVGLLLGCAVAVALGVMRPRVGSRDRAEERLGYPVLAAIPFSKERSVKRDPLMLQRGSGWGAEGIRMLRTELQLIEGRGPSVKVIVIVSPEPRDGKSTVAANLASAFQRGGRQTVLVHADLHVDRGTRAGTGLTDFLSGETPDVPVQRHPGGFFEVPAGPMRTEIRGTMKDGLALAIRALRTSYEIVIVDTPPLLASADALVLASEADAVVLVVRQGVTREAKAAEAIDTLVRHDAPLAGLVLNGIRIGRVERYRYRRYYGRWAAQAPEATEGAELPVEPIAVRGRHSVQEPPPAPAPATPPAPPEPVAPTPRPPAESTAGAEPPAWATPESRSYPVGEDVAPESSVPNEPEPRPPWPRPVAETRDEVDELSSGTHRSQGRDQAG